MRLDEVIQQHHTLSNWLEDAKAATIQEVQRLLQTEATNEPEWFLAHRRSRLRQLIIEVLTLNIVQSSENEWNENDFMGHQHSDAITAAINAVYPAVRMFYTKLAVQVRQSHQAVTSPKSTVPQTTH